jgi:hypothetical protein
MQLNENLLIGKEEKNQKEKANRKRDKKILLMMREDYIVLINKTVFVY